MQEHENTFRKSSRKAGLAASSRIPLPAPKAAPGMPRFGTRAQEAPKVEQLKKIQAGAPFKTFYVHDEDDRAPVLEIIYPYNVICLLQIKSHYGRDPLQGTGFFISPKCILTAGHCVFDHDWMQWIKVIPGALGAEAPFGHAVGKTFRSVEGWTVSKDADYDYGAIILDDDSLYQKINAHIGFKATAMPAKVEIAGYPKDKGQTPHTAQGPVSSQTGTRYFYPIDTEAGNSGSPIFPPGKQGVQAVGIHTNGSFPENYGLRFRPDLIDRINEWTLL